MTKKCAECGVDEWRIDGYCTVDCQRVAEARDEERAAIVADLRELCGSRHREGGGWTPTELADRYESGEHVKKGK